MPNYTKLRLKISTRYVNVETLYSALNSRYSSILYFGLHIVDDQPYIYIKHRTMMYSNVLKKIFKDLLEIEEITKYVSLEGDVIHESIAFWDEEKGKMSRNVTNNNEVDAVIFNIYNEPPVYDFTPEIYQQFHENRNSGEPHVIIQAFHKLFYIDEKKQLEFIESCGRHG